MAKKALPSISVNEKTHTELATIAKEAQDNRARLNDLTTTEGQLKTDLSELTDGIRVAEQANGNYIGVVKITNEDSATVQVQYKLSSAGKDAEGNMVRKGFAVDQLPTLEHFYGSSRPLLFEKTLEVTEITDPDALIAEIRARGQNPWDVLDIKLKKSLDRAVADSPNVTKAEMYMPKDGLLATLNEVADTLTPEAKEFTNNYLNIMLKPAVNLGLK